MSFRPGRRLGHEPRADALAVGLRSDELDAEPVAVACRRCAGAGTAPRSSTRRCRGRRRCRSRRPPSRGRRRASEGRTAARALGSARAVVPQHSWSGCAYGGALSPRLFGDVAVGDEDVEVAVVVRRPARFRPNLTWFTVGGPKPEETERSSNTPIRGCGSTRWSRSRSWRRRGRGVRRRRGRRRRPPCRPEVALQAEPGPRRDRDVLEAPVAEIAEEEVHELVVGDVEVGPAVAVHVDEHRPRAPCRRLFRGPPPS